MSRLDLSHSGGFPPADPDIVRSKTIKNGLTRKVAKGDVIVVPPGTPHWFDAIDGNLNCATNVWTANQFTTASPYGCIH